MLRILAETQPVRAFELAAGIQEPYAMVGGNLLSPIDQSIVAALVRHDPAYAVEQLEEGGLKMSGFELTIARSWAEIDPVSAVAWARQQSNDSDHLRDQTVSAAYEQWSLQDPRAAAKSLAALPRDEQPFDTAITVASHLDNPIAAASWLSELGKGEFGMRAVAKYLDKTRPDVETALAIFDQAPAEWTSKLGIDPVMAGVRDRGDLERIGQWLDDRGDQELLKRLGSHWARKDPEVALDFAHQLKEGSPFLSGAYHAIARLEPMGALEALAEFPAEFQKDIRKEAISRLEIYDPVGLADFIGALPEAEQRGHDDFRGLTTWASQEPAAAADWLVSLEERDGRRRAFRGLVDRWSKADSYAASQWIAEMPKGALRDDAITALVKEIRTDDLPAAHTWAEQIGDEPARDAARKLLNKPLP